MRFFFRQVVFLPLFLAAICCSGKVSDQDPGSEVSSAREMIVGGLDLTGKEVAEGPYVEDLFEQRPPGSYSFHLIDGVEVTTISLEEAVYFVPWKNRFYVKKDEVFASSMTFYGPFEGNPRKVMTLPDPSVWEEK